jgi:hypothetical protein|tara:strand:+ start:44 stop:535 length:492 start_codon:yes stop_codon:yes gene_type:complete
MAKHLLLLLILVSILVKADGNAGAAEIFDKMKLLEGIWEKEGATNSKFTISFELTANDTVLVETWNYEGKKHSLTIYHLDGKDLIATHYCPQGNQPRLKLKGKSTKSNISFEYFDATNLESIENSHQHSLSIILSDPLNRIQRKESYMSKAGEEPSELVLIRK